MKNYTRTGRTLAVVLKLLGEGDVNSDGGLLHEFYPHFVVLVASVEYIQNCWILHYNLISL